MLTKSDLQKISGLMKNETKPVVKRLTRIEKIIKEDFNFLDRLHIKNAKAINRVEIHLGFPESELMIP